MNASLLDLINAGQCEDARQSCAIHIGELMRSTLALSGTQASPKRSDTAEFRKKHARINFYSAGSQAPHHLEMSWAFFRFPCGSAMHLRLGVLLEWLPHLAAISNRAIAQMRLR